MLSMVLASRCATACSERECVMQHNSRHNASPSFYVNGFNRMRSNQLRSCRRNCRVFLCCGNRELLPLRAVIARRIIRLDRAGYSFKRTSRSRIHVAIAASVSEPAANAVIT